MATTGPAHVLIDGAKVRELRQLQGLTQLALGDKAGMAAPYLSQIETGARATVTPPMFVRICDALGVPAHERRSMIRSQAVA